MYKSTKIDVAEPKAIKSKMAAAAILKSLERR